MNQEYIRDDNKRSFSATKTSFKPFLALILGAALVACNGSGGSSATSGTTGSTDLASAHATSANSSNPFTGAHQYVNPDYQAEIAAFKAANSGYDASYAENKSTAVWVDRESAISGYTNSSGTKINGVSYHLAEALSQANVNGTPTVISLVVYDLPDRDCAAYSSNGEIKSYPDSSKVSGSLNQYYHHYIDPLNAAINDFYAANPDAVGKVRTVLLIEPDSLPNMITNTNANVNGGSSSYQVCQFVSDNREYVQGVSYALNMFASNTYASSLYMYLDIAHSGWMGWSSNVNEISKLFNNKQAMDTSTPYGGLGSGFNSVRGFVLNTANYTPLTETFGTSEAKAYRTYLNRGSDITKGIISTNYYQWNDVYSLGSYMGEIMAIDAKTGMLTQDNHAILQPTSGALYQNMHFLVDTSRNGWNTQETYTDSGNNVTYSRYELRNANANWCNVQNIILNGQTVSPGLGLSPQADPVLANPLVTDDNIILADLPIDAYIWVKPPGESDGNYDSTTNVGDQMCGNGDGGFHNGSVSTDALQNGSSPAPVAGAWFDLAFERLLANKIN